MLLRLYGLAKINVIESDIKTKRKKKRFRYNSYII